jgi:hypothetical protein
MEVDAQPKWMADLDPIAINSLSINNDRITEGQDLILMNPSLEDVPDEQIFERLEEMLKSKVITDKLSEIEDANRSKFGPRSIAVPWEERKASLFAYYNHKEYHAEPFATSNGRLRPTSISQAGQHLIKSSSAGLPYMQRKGMVLDKAIDSFSRNKGVYPCVLYTRTQEEKKTRNVWGFPIADVLFEQMFFLPWLSFEKNLFYRSALLGPEAVDTAMTKLLASKSDNHNIVSVDFSSYDASVSPELTYDAFNSIAQAFQSAYLDQLYEVYDRFVNIGVYTPEGEILGPHGVPSGSSWTNTIDSLVQMSFGGQFTNLFQVQGDDGVYVIDKSDLNDFYSSFKEGGLMLNESKSDVFDSPEAIYLQRYYNPIYQSRSGGLGGVYSIYRAMLRIKYLERWTDFDKMGISGADFFSLRTIMILENCKHHPCFVELVRYVQSLDKYGLQYSRSGSAAYSRSMESKARAGLFGSDTFKEGINSFETVKLLKTN